MNTEQEGRDGSFVLIVNQEGQQTMRCIALTIFGSATDAEKKRIKQALRSELVSQFEFAFVEWSPNNGSPMSVTAEMSSDDIDAANDILMKVFGDSCSISLKPAAAPR